jgi:hypothetical protein
MTELKPASLPPTVIDTYAVPGPKALSWEAATFAVVAPEHARKFSE